MTEESLVCSLSMSEGRGSSLPPAHLQLKYTSGRPKPPGSELSLYDVLAVAVRCTHGNMPLATVHNVSGHTSSTSSSSSSVVSGLWLPYIALRKDCYKVGIGGGGGEAVALLGQFLLEEAKQPMSSTELVDADQMVTTPPPPPFEKVALHSLTRIQLPNGRFISRLIYLGRWSADVACCGQPNNSSTSGSNLTWVPVSSVLSSSSSSSSASHHHHQQAGRLWGAEVATYAVILNSAAKMGHFLDSAGNGGNRNRSPMPALSEVTLDEHVLKYVQRKSPPPVSGINSTEVVGTTVVGSSAPNDSAVGEASEQCPPSAPPTATTASFMEYVASAKFSDEVVLQLYSDYVQHCYPATSMTAAAYRAYLASIQLDVHLSEAKQSSLFQASNYKTRGFLSFNELLLGLVSLDPASAHCRARYAFVFRYYNSAGDGALSKADMGRLLADTRPFAQWKPQSGGGAKSGGGGLSLADFVEEITSERLKGTGALCRSTRSVLKLLREHFFGSGASSVGGYEVISSAAVRSGSLVVEQLAANCARCRPKTYSLAVHTVELAGGGGGLHKPKVVGIPGGSGSGSLAIEADDQTSAALNSNNSLPAHLLTAIKRQHSLELTFSRTAVAGYVLELVRRLRDFNRLSAERQSVVRTEVTAALTVGLVNALCEEVSEVLAAESRVLQVSTPTFVMGDIHGNINDLLTFERQLWPMAPMAQTANVLFLGDYVDRGEFGVEVVCYLFAMKLLAPTRFFLLRGNHEIRQIQRNFTFEKECLDKYGTGGAGLAVFEKFNSAFDQLPFSAVIDESIFCAHGGIPFSVLTIDGLNQLPGGVAEPEKEAPAIWEVRKEFLFGYLVF